MASRRHVVTLTALAAALTVGGFALARRTAPEPEPQAAPRAVGDRDLLAYGLGFNLGTEVREGLAVDGIDVDFEIIRRGFADGLLERRPTYSERDLDVVLRITHQKMQELMVKRMLAEDPAFRDLYEKNARASVAFLDANRRKSGVVEMGNGVQYRELKAGTGDMPDLEDTVIVSFRATLADGTFVDEGTRVSMHVSSILSGAREAVLRMRAGAKWELVLPPDQAYGGPGDPPLVGPNQIIMGEIELHAVESGG